MHTIITMKIAALVVCLSALGPDGVEAGNLVKACACIFSPSVTNNTDEEKPTSTGRTSRAVPQPSTIQSSDSDGNVANFIYEKDSDGQVIATYSRFGGGPNSGDNTVYRLISGTFTEQPRQFRNISPHETVFYIFNQSQFRVYSVKTMLTRIFDSDAFEKTDPEADTWSQRFPSFLDESENSSTTGSSAGGTATGSSAGDTETGSSAGGTAMSQELDDVYHLPANASEAVLCTPVGSKYFIVNENMFYEFSVTFKDGLATTYTKIGTGDAYTAKHSGVAHVSPDQYFSMDVSDKNQIEIRTYMRIRGSDIFTLPSDMNEWLGQFDFRRDGLLNARYQISESGVITTYTPIDHMSDCFESSPESSHYYRISANGSVEKISRHDNSLVNLSSGWSDNYPCI